MNIFLSKDPSDTAYNWQEWEIQAYIIQEARRAGYFIEGDQNQAKRSFAAAARAKACGMQSGTTDMRVLFDGPATVWIELKVLNKKRKGKLSGPQKNWHEAAKTMGHHVFTVYALHPLDGWTKVKEILTVLRPYLGNSREQTKTPCRNCLDPVLDIDEHSPNCINNPD